MISVIGIGNAASAIAEKFSDVDNYEVYLLNDKTEKSTRTYTLKTFSSPEEYETNVPDLKDFFTDIRNRVQVFIMGSSMSSNYVLGILEQIKDKEIDLFYIRPDTELLTGVPSY